LLPADVGKVFTFAPISFFLISQVLNPCAGWSNEINYLRRHL
jgi:hypothetical protein